MFRFQEQNLELLNQSIPIDLEIGSMKLRILVVMSGHTHILHFCLCVAKKNMILPREIQSTPFVKANINMSGPFIYVATYVRE